MTKNLSKKLISDLIDKFVNKEATLYTDEYTISYDIIKHTKILNHHTINHSKKQYAIGKIHVNNCENRHSLLRPFLKIFRGISKRYLEGYIMLYQYIFNYKEDTPDKILETILKNCNLKSA